MRGERNLCYASCPINGIVKRYAIRVGKREDHTNADVLPFAIKVSVCSGPMPVE